MSGRFSRSLVAGCLWSAAVLGTPALAQPSTEPARLEPALRQVVLSTGGVALYQYEAVVDGRQTLGLTVRLDQVDDVLRSLVVADPAGAADFATLSVRSPLEERFRDLPFGPDALESPDRLLNALRGATVSIAGPGAVRGKIVSVVAETVTSPQTGAQSTRHRLSLLTDQGLRQAILEDVSNLSFEDADVRAALNTALAALAQAREKDTRTVSITVADGGSRTLYLAYLSEAPLWKTSYRLILPRGAEAQGEGEASGRLAGWATLENISGQDWSNIRLTVLSGNPVTFRQNLYNSYRVERPLVPVEVYGRVLPGVDEGAFATAQDSADMERKVPRPSPAAAGMARQAARLAEPIGEAVASSDGNSGLPVYSARYGAAPVAAAEASSVTAQVLHTFPTPITLPNGQSLLAPLLDLAVPVRRVVHIVPTDRTVRPMAAVQITNTTDSALPPGPISLTQETAVGLTFVGDARMGVVPKGESRLLDFAVDNDISVIVSDQAGRRAAGLSAADGAVSLRTVIQNTTRYVIRNASEDSRTVVIDHPRKSGWTLKTPDGVDKVEETATSYRLTLSMEAGAERSYAVTLERTERETLAAGRMNVSSLARLSADGDLSEAERDAVGRLSALATRVADARAVIERVERDISQRMVTQVEVRENLQAVPKGSDLQKRYLKRMADLDDEMTELEKQRSKAQSEVAAAERDFDKLVAGLKLP